jgi:hypothetical protein
MPRKSDTKIIFSSPILQGRVEKTFLPCGKKNCACNKDLSKLHGPYYRWTGHINGKQTSRSLSKIEAGECKNWIGNYKKLQVKITKLLKISLESAPWNTRDER